MPLSAALSALHSFNPAGASSDGKPLGGAKMTPASPGGIKKPQLKFTGANGKTYNSRADYDAEMDAVQNRHMVAAERGRQETNAVAARDAQYGENAKTRQHDIDMLRERERANNSHKGDKEIDAIIGGMPPPGFGGVDGTMPTPVGGGGEVRAPGLLPEGSGEEAAFARGKDRIGATSGAALKSLRNSMDARGISGGGAEAAATASLLGDTAGDLGELSRDISIEGARRSQDVEDRNYAGGLAKRGQDIDIWRARNEMMLNALRMKRQPLY